MKRHNMTSNLAAVAASALVLTSANAWAGLVIYEPFAQNTGNLADQAAGSTGMTGNWEDTGPWDEPLVVSGSMSYGSLATSGNSLGGTPAGGDDRGFADASLGGSLSGHLDNGDVLWFSLLWEATAAARTGQFMLTSEAGAYQQSTIFRPNSGSDSNTTIDGFGFQTQSGKLGGLAVADGVQANGALGALLGLNETRLIVGKITWGAGATDTLDLYLPGTDLVLPGTAYATQTASIDQSGLNYLALGGNDQVLNMDEIRFGTSYADVTPVPEPSSTALLGLGGLALILRRRK